MSKSLVSMKIATSGVPFRSWEPTISLCSSDSPILLDNCDIFLLGMSLSLTFSHSVLFKKYFDIWYILSLKKKCSLFDTEITSPPWSFWVFQKSECLTFLCKAHFPSSPTIKTCVCICALNFCECGIENRDLELHFAQ